MCRYLELQHITILPSSYCHPVHMHACLQLFDFECAHVCALRSQQPVHSPLCSHAHVARPSTFPFALSRPPAFKSCVRGSASSSSYSRSPRSAHTQGIFSFQTVVSFFFFSRGKHTFSPTHARTPLTEPSVASTRSKVCSHMH